MRASDRSSVFPAKSKASKPRPPSYEAVASDQSHPKGNDINPIAARYAAIRNGTRGRGTVGSPESERAPRRRRPGFVYVPRVGGRFMAVLLLWQTKEEGVVGSVSFLLFQKQ